MSGRQTRGFSGSGGDAISSDAVVWASQTSAHCLESIWEPANTDARDFPTPTCPVLCDAPSLRTAEPETLSVWPAAEALAIDCVATADSRIAIASQRSRVSPCLVRA